MLLEPLTSEGPRERRTLGNAAVRQSRQLPHAYWRVGSGRYWRGPASPIYGPAKIGGYLNFNPKSARVEETGAFIEDVTGAISFSGGSWDRSVLTAEVGGPGELFGKPMGYYIYGELENSDSYYVNHPESIRP